jgi:hypothetical protein
MRPRPTQGCSTNKEEYSIEAWNEYDSMIVHRLALPQRLVSEHRRHGKFVSVDICENEYIFIMRHSGR